MYRMSRIGRRVLSVTLKNDVPCIGRYLGCLLLEQLVHTCPLESAETETTFSHLIHWIVSITMVIAGFLRAKTPLDNTDIPFLICLSALVVMAIVPPPSILATGPLCGSSTVFFAAERIVRAISFASLYCTFVFVSMPPSALSCSTLTVIRAFTSSVWVLSSPRNLLIATLPMCMIAVCSRLARREKSTYDTISTVSPPPENLSVTDVLIDTVPLTESTTQRPPQRANKTCNFSSDEMAKIAERLS